jgi:hypothetical protein
MMGLEVDLGVPVPPEADDETVCPDSCGAGAVAAGEWKVDFPDICANNGAGRSIAKAADVAMILRSDIIIVPPIEFVSVPLTLRAAIEFPP